MDEYPRLTRLQNEPRIQLDKRQAVPYLLEVRCPGCGRVLECDLSDWYHLSYPVVGKKTSFQVGCYGANGCDTECVVDLVVDLTVTLA